MVWRRVGIQDDKQNRATVTPDGALNVALTGASVDLELPDSLDVNVTNESLPVQVEFPSEVLDVHVTNQAELTLPPVLDVNVTNQPELSLPTVLDVNVTNSPTLELPEVLDVNVLSEVRVTGTGTPLPVEISGDFNLGSTMGSYPASPPGYVESYAAGVSDAPSTLGWRTILSVHLPVGASRKAIISGWRVTSYNQGAQTSARSLAVFPISNAANGTQIPPSWIKPFSGGSVQPVLQVNRDNPDIYNPGAEMFACAPALAPSNSVVSNTAGSWVGSPGVTLVGGQGLAFRVFDGGATARWGVHVTWSEHSL